MLGSADTLNTGSTSQRAGAGWRHVLRPNSGVKKGGSQEGSLGCLALDD